MTKLPSNQRILLLEDDENLRELVRESLEDEGYRVRPASSGAAAIALAEAEPFELLLSDVRLGGSMDGVTALERIQALQPTIRSIIMTGFADETVPVRAMKLQADDYLLKGATDFGVASLLQAVRDVLSLGQRKDELMEILWHRLQKTDHTSDQWLGLYTTRYQVVGQLYLAMRSQHLAVHPAAAAWARLLELDSELLQLREQSRADCLTEAYQQLEQDLQSASFAGAAADPSFQPIYADALAGKLDGDRLATLALLRAEPELARQSVGSHLLFTRYLR